MALFCSMMLDLLIETIGSLFGILCLLWGIAVQILIFWSTRETKEKALRWLLPVLFGGGAVAFIALIFLFESFFSLLAIALLPYLILVLMGTLVGTVLYKLWTKVHTS